MLLILVALIAAMLIAAYFKQRGRYSLFSEVVCPIVVIMGFIGLFVYCFLVYDYIAAGYKKEIINREYGTNYTRQEVFYASDVIETVRELNRTRLEVNGDLLKDK